MRTLVFGLGVALLATGASAQVHVKGYTKSDGTYVSPYTRSNPNKSAYDNYSSKGNVNPYTGQTGTKNPYGSSPYSSGSYGSGSSKKSKQDCTYFCN